jgi:hypothetical protein
VRTPEVLGTWSVERYSMKADAGIELATFLLALATTLAVIVSILLWSIDRGVRSKREKRREREATVNALRQLHEIVRFFQHRMVILKGEAVTNAVGLAHGCDACLATALSDSVTRAISPDVAKTVYDALFAAYNVLAKAIYRQRAVEQQNGPAIQETYDAAGGALAQLTGALSALEQQLARAETDGP